MPGSLSIAELLRQGDRVGVASGVDVYQKNATTIGVSVNGTEVATFSADGLSLGDGQFAAPGASAVGDTQSAGSASTIARSDHRHAREAFGSPAASAVGDAQSAGSGTTVARANHVHARESFAAPTAQAVGDTLAAGSSTSVSRADHVHGVVDQYNQLTNGGFEIWQRGAGAFTANAAYAADRWQIGLAGSDTLSVSQITAAANRKANSKNSAGCTFVLSGGAGATYLRQVLKVSDGYDHLLGAAVSCRIAVKVAAASAVRAYAKSDGTGGTTTYSGYHTGGGSFEDLTVQNVSVPADATYVEVGLAFAASCTAYADDAMLNLGAVAAVYAGLQPSEDLARCLRYYAVIGGAALSVDWQGYAPAGATVAVATWFFPVPMATTPTITKNGTWTVTNAGQPSGNSPNTTSVRILAAITGAGVWAVQSANAGTTLTAEANP